MKKKYSKHQIEVITEQAALENLWADIQQTYSIGESRDRYNVMYRHSIAVAMRVHGNISLTIIGKILKRNHATVIHAMKNHDGNYKYDKSYREIYLAIEKLVKDALDEYDLRHVLIEDMSQTSMDYTSVVRVYKQQVNELELTITRLKLEIKEANSQRDKTAKNANEIYERNKSLNELVIRYKNLI